MLFVEMAFHFYIDTKLAVEYNIFHFQVEDKRGYANN